MNAVVRRLGLCDYETVWRAMQAYTAACTAAATDEIWLLEHRPVLTLGLGGRREHVLDDRGVPVVHCDRGGQVTYHAPGQLVAYLLLDLKRRGLTVKTLVQRIEQSVIDLLGDYGIVASRRDGAPGVYVDGAKIAALGFRVRRGCCYHGLALNVELDLAPYSGINPCGFPGLAVTRLRDLGVTDGVAAVGERLLPHLIASLAGNRGSPVGDGLPARSVALG